jgi:hypothetical protein
MYIYLYPNNKQDVVQRRHVPDLDVRVYSTLQISVLVGFILSETFKNLLIGIMTRS